MLLCFDGSSDDAPEQTVHVLDQLTNRKTRLSSCTGFDEEDFSVIHVKTLLVITRSNDADVGERIAFFKEMQPDFDVPTLNVRLDDPQSIEDLRNAIYNALGVIRIYTKKPGKPADYVDPFTIPTGGTIEDLAFKVHRDLAETLKFAKVWGESAHDGQSVGREHVLADRDMVELHS